MRGQPSALVLIFLPLICILPQKHVEKRRDAGSHVCCLHDVLDELELGCGFHVWWL